MVFPPNHLARFLLEKRAVTVPGRNSKPALTIQPRNLFSSTLSHGSKPATR